MYGGKVTQVKLEAENSMAGIIIDRFGIDTPMTPISDTRFEAMVEVALSTHFYGWIFSLGPDIKITAPASAVREISEAARKIGELYE